MQWVGAKRSGLWVYFLGVGMVWEREEQSKGEKEREVEVRSATSSDLAPTACLISVKAEPLPRVGYGLSEGSTVSFLRTLFYSLRT